MMFNIRRRERSVVTNVFIILLLAVFIAVSVFYFVSQQTKPTDRKGLKSTELKHLKTENDTVQRITYIDDEGNPVFASDKHYATITKTKIDHSILEEYFDEVGFPALQSAGHYAILRDYDEQDRNYRITYLSEHGKPFITTNGYAIILRCFNVENQIEYERYLDCDGKPAKSNNGSYGRHNEYKNGRNTVITYLGEKDEPIITTSGYACLRRVFYETEGVENGKVESEFYFDPDDKPVALANGQYGVHHSYDENGRASELTYLDEKGMPAPTRQGYTTIRRTFDKDGGVATEHYFDREGNPIRLSFGQYGIRHSGGKTIYLDRNDQRLFILNIFLRENPLSVLVLGLFVVAVSLFTDRRVNTALFAVYLIFIFYMTLMYRNVGESRANLELFWSYRDFFSNPGTRMEILFNIWLFVPLGVIVGRMKPKAVILIVPLLISAGIEAVQYFTGLGLCEWDDIVSNGLGAVLGYFLSRVSLTNLCDAIKRYKEQMQCH